MTTSSPSTSAVASGRGNTSRRRWAAIREAVATRVWPLPVAAIAASVLLGILLPVVDAAVDSSLAPAFGSLLFDGGTDSARAVLSAIAASLITATSLTFSLTVVALQLASSQASPRILRMFAQDRMVHATLAIFLGTFAYALTVLRTVEDATDASSGVVPRIAVTVASLAMLVSVVMLTLFLAHLATQLRVETMMRNVHVETRATIRLVAESTGATAPAEAVERPRITAPSVTSGFLSSVNRSRLLDLAESYDLVIIEAPTLGSSVIKGQPIAWWSRRDPLKHEIAGSDEDAEISELIARSFSLSYERTASQDIGFGFRQLVDIAVRALSPGVNDPTTAVHALSHISALLCDLTSLPEQPRAVADDSGVVRVVQRTHDFEALLDLALQQVRRYGSDDPDVVRRLYLLLREVAYVTTSPDYRTMLTAQLARLDETVGRADYDSVEREQFASLSAEVTDTVADTLPR